MLHAELSTADPRGQRSASSKTFAWTRVFWHERPEKIPGHGSLCHIGVPFQHTPFPEPLVMRNTGKRLSWAESPCALMLWLVRA